MTLKSIFIYSFLQFIIISNCSAAESDIGNRVNEKTIILDDNVDFNYYHFAAQSNNSQNTQSNTVALWLMPRYHAQKKVFKFAQQLSVNNIEVWAVDLLDNLFKPKNVQSLRELSGQYVSKLIKQIHIQTNKKIVLLADSYTAIPLLRGAHLWQLSKPSRRYLTGAVLFSPNLFEAIPTLGNDPKFVDIATVTSIPILLYQSEKSSTRGQLPQLLTALQQGKASVYTSILKDSLGIFYNEDNSLESMTFLKQLPTQIAVRLKLLESSPLPLSAQAIKAPKIIQSSTLNSSLKKYQAKNLPYEIDLVDVFGQAFKKTNYKNQITIVNFWATWCKPCLEEIPSLNRLKKIMKTKPFEIISIDYAEKPAVIKKFMEKIAIDFPVLIDESGLQAVKWNVYAFPSTFVIGPDGKFHYGVNAGILWDSPAVIATLNQLLIP